MMTTVLVGPMLVLVALMSFMAVQGAQRNTQYITTAPPIVRYVGPQKLCLGPDCWEAKEGEAITCQPYVAKGNCFIATFAQ